MIMQKRSIQRETLLNILCGTKTHPTADWLYNEARKVLPNISLGTVYRNLSAMSQSGQISRLSTGCGSERFDGDTRPHYHFVCDCCGRVDDLNIEYNSAIDLMAEHEGCGTVSGHALFFHGCCQDCLAKTVSEKE